MNKTKKILYIFAVIAFLSIVLLYSNERLRYEKQSEIASNSLFHEMGNEIADMNILVNGFRNGDNKENIHSFFNKIHMDISNVRVLLNVSRYGKGLSKEESSDMLELLNFHDYLSEAMLAMNYFYNKNGTLSDEHLTDLDTLRKLFYDISSKELESDKVYTTWYTIIMFYEESFSDTGLISSYYY